MTKRVLIADDHSLFREGIASLIRASGMTVVAEVDNGAKAVEATLDFHPDIVLMDIHMPIMNGLEALQQIMLQAPETQVVMLTISDDDQHLFNAIKQGAQGYLLKNLDSKGFIASLKGLEHGEAPITRKMTRRLISLMSSGITHSNLESCYALLTSREAEILRLASRGLSNKLTAQRLRISENTVKYHMKNIFKKLGVRNRAEAAAYAVQTGLVSANEISGIRAELFA